MAPTWNEAGREGGSRRPSNQLVGLALLSEPGPGSITYVTRRGQWWNHNPHYHGLILEAIPPGCQRVLDVGCGEGMLARQLARLVPHVVGLDSDAASLGLARRQDPDG